MTKYTGEFDTFSEAIEFLEPRVVIMQKLDSKEEFLVGKALEMITIACEWVDEHCKQEH